MYHNYLLQIRKLSPKKLVKFHLINSETWGKPRKSGCRAYVLKHGAILHPQSCQPIAATMQRHWSISNSHCNYHFKILVQLIIQKQESVKMNFKSYFRSGHFQLLRIFMAQRVSDAQQIIERLYLRS